MRKNLGLLAILAVVIVVVAVSGCSNNNTTNNTNANAMNEKSTKLMIINNNPNVWLHMDLVIENATMKNGTVQTFYAEAFMQPGANATIDLSNLLGYGNEKLPAGTTIRILSWKGLLMNTTSVNVSNANWNGTVGGTSILNMTLQGWSNTLTPGSNDPKTNITFNNPPLNISALAKNITKTSVFIATNPTDLDWTDNDADEPLFEEEIISVDANGRVTITLTVPPELCQRIAHII